MTDTPGVESTSVEATIREFLRRSKKQDDVDVSTSLFAGGVGLDSLATAELSVTLEDEFGHDPFSEGQMPQTIAEIIDYYRGSAAQTTAG